MFLPPRVVHAETPMPTFAPEKLAAWTGGGWSRLPDRALTGFTQDTRQLGAGQIFVALKTDKRDGHDFLFEAQRSGASAALVCQPDRNLQLPQLVVADPLAAFQRIAREHRREFHGTVIGVSGSAGKTSTKDLLALLLGESPAVLSTTGNLNNYIGVPLTLTRLDPASHSAAVIEAGINMPGEMAGLAEMIEPDHSVITLVAAAHLEKLGSLAGVAFEKSRLPAANRPGGLAVFPASCWAYEPFRTLANPLVLVPANEGMTKIAGRSVSFTIFHRPERTEVTLNGKRPFIMRRVSSGMAQNAALALALASALGLADDALHEEALLLLLRALVTAGRRAEAARAYAMFEGRCRRELESAPGPEVVAAVVSKIVRSTNPKLRTRLTKEATIFPFLPRSRMTARATVDLPQPDSPTSPMLSPGITVQEKSITAGISRRRVKNEIERCSISRMGLDGSQGSDMVRSPLVAGTGGYVWLGGTDRVGHGVSPSGFLRAIRRPEDSGQGRGSSRRGRARRPGGSRATAVCVRR